MDTNNNKDSNTYMDIHINADFYSNKYINTDSNTNINLDKYTNNDKHTNAYININNNAITIRNTNACKLSVFTNNNNI